MYRVLVDYIQYTEPYFPLNTRNLNKTLFIIWSRIILYSVYEALSYKVKQTQQKILMYTVHCNMFSKRYQASFITRSLIILRSVYEALSHYVQSYGTEDFSIRSLILQRSECGDLLDCSVCRVLSYYVQNVEIY